MRAFYCNIPGYSPSEPDPFYLSRSELRYPLALSRKVHLSIPEKIKKIKKNNKEREKKKNKKK